MNIYYSPGKFGLKTVGEIDWSSGEYQFDLTVVWQDDNGAFWYAEDSGCSCPSPFEDVKGMDDLTKIESYAAFQTFLSGHDERQGESRNSQVIDLLERLYREGLR